MALRKKNKIVEKGSARLSTKLKVGDTVVVLAGGNSIAGKQLKGKTGKILRFLPKKDRVIVEGLNIAIRHRRATSANNPGGKIEKEASIHISNVNYFSSELGAAVKLTYKTLEDGRKVRGYFNPKKEDFEQIDI